ncbi:hypothetical protein EDD11_003645 [Mortierella claussenii]|nr:hypothetical protein EDD11_003645 [Mortierella claussenii]
MAQSSHFSSRTEAPHLSDQMQAIDNVLAAASNLHLTPPSADQQNNACADVLLKSARIGQLIMEIQRMQEQIAYLEAQIRYFQKQQLAGDIQSLDTDARIRCLEQFAQQLSSVNENRMQLVEALSEARRPEYLLLRPECHQDFRELSSKIQDVFPRIQQSLEAIAWSDEFLQSQTAFKDLVQL